MIRLRGLAQTLAPGLLLAAPALTDPNFARSVVLLATHDETGALGWVLNGKSILPTKKLLEDADLVPPGLSLPDSPSFHAAVRVGGPVMPGSAWILFERPTADAPSPAFVGEHDLGGGFFVTGAREAIEALARGEGPERFRLFLGYAGWGKQQVDREIARGDWLPHDVLTDLLLDEPADSMWNAAYAKSVGVSPMAFTGTVRGSA